MTDLKATLRNHMEMLCDKIGPRPTGSLKNMEALNYVFNVLQKCGLQVRKQEFNCIDWKNSGATLLLDGKKIPVEPAGYSLPCKLEAGIICIDTIDVLKNADLSGKIAVLYGGLCKEPLMPKNFVFYNPDEHKLIISLLEEKNPCAIIFVSPHDDIPLHIIRDGDFNIPCAVVCGNLLNVLLENNSRKVKLTISTERIPATAYNVIAAYGNKKEKVCFSAHIDTKPATPGALDNASGVAALLTLAESFAGKEYNFQIEIVLFNGEDYYSVPGEMAFMASLAPEYKYAFNLDGIGLKNSNTSVSFYECPIELENEIMEHAKAISGIERIEGWPMGDHMIFAQVGIPAIAITASNIFSLVDTVIHTQDDDLKNIDFDVLNKVVCFLMNCIR